MMLTTNESPADKWLEAKRPHTIMNTGHINKTQNEEEIEDRWYPLSFESTKIAA